MRYIEAVRAQGKNLRSSRAAVTAQGPGPGALAGPAARPGGHGGQRERDRDCVIGSYWAAGLPATSWLGSDRATPGAAGNFDAVIAVSQSGKSTEIVAA